MMEVRTAESRTVRRERMKEGDSGSCPVDKLDSQFESSLRLAYEIDLVDSEHAVKAADRGQRRFADSNGTNLARFDHCDRFRPRTAQKVRDCRCSHPPSCAAAYDDDAFDCSMRHGHQGGAAAQCRAMNSA